MDREGCVVGLDMGTTSAKATVFDADGRVIASAAASVETAHSDEGAAEQDPNRVYEAVTTALATAVTQARHLGYGVDRVGMSAAMHSLIPVKEDGTPLAPAMLWMDNRARHEADALWQTPEGKGIYERTGTPVHAMSPLAKLIWMREHRRDVWTRARRFVSLKEYVWHNWFAEWQIDASLASSTGLYNLHEGTWDDDALRAAAIGQERLSELVPTTYVRAGIRDRILLDAGLDSSTTFNIGASDGVLANLGVGAIAGDVMVMTIGTSLAVRMGTAVPVFDDSTRLFCYVLGDGRFVAGGPSNSGGVVLDWLYRNVLGGPAVNAETPELPAGFLDLLAAAGKVENEELLCLPYVAGERAPLWNVDASGVVFGLRLRHTAADVMRAAVEGIIFNAYWIAAEVIERVGKPQEIVATGKVLQTEWIRQLVADTFGVPVRDLGDVDASATGAAALANIATQRWSWDEAVTRLRSTAGSVCEPRDHARVHARYQRFRRMADVLATGFGDL